MPRHRAPDPPPSGAAPAGAPWASVELVLGDVLVGGGAVQGHLPCDLRLVDLLFQLRSEACRQGWNLRITEVRPHLADLVELVGLGAHISRATTDDGVDG